MKILYDFHHGVKRYLKEFVQIKTDPLMTALGFSIGIFWSVLFTPGFSLILILLTIAFLRINKFGAILGYAANLPIFIPLNYVYSYKIGSWLLGKRVGAEVSGISLAFLKTHFSRFILGNLLLSVALAIASFIVVFLIATFIVWIRKRKKVSKKE